MVYYICGKIIMIYTLLNGDVIDVDTISWIGDVGGFGGNSMCYYTSYAYRTYTSDTQYVTLSCEPDWEKWEKILQKIKAEADYLKNYMLYRQQLIKDMPHEHDR